MDYSYQELEIRDTHQYVADLLTKHFTFLGRYKLLQAIATAKEDMDRISDNSSQEWMAAVSDAGGVSFTTSMDIQNPIFIRIIMSAHDISRPAFFIKHRGYGHYVVICGHVGEIQNFMRPEGYLMPAVMP